MNIHSSDHSLHRRLGEIPTLLLAYAIFAIVVTIADFAILPFAPLQFKADLIAYTGWGASAPYPLTLIFVVVLIFQAQRRRYVRMLGIAFPLLVKVGFGIYDIFKFGEPHYNNPYLMISPLRPIWTILIPAVWIVILYLPNLNRFCDQQAANQEA